MLDTNMAMLQELHRRQADIVELQERLHYAYQRTIFAALITLTLGTVIGYYAAVIFR